MSKTSYHTFKTGERLYYTAAEPGTAGPCASRPLGTPGRPRFKVTTRKVPTTAELVSEVPAAALAALTATQEANS